jgi:hypothetical protein
MQGIYRYLNLAGVLESTFLVGCYEAKDGKGTAKVLADEIHKVKLDALDFDSHLAAEDDCLPVGMISNITTDTALVISSTARILNSNYRLVQGMIRTPCMCHVLNLNTSVSVTQYYRTHFFKRISSRGCKQ